MNKFFLLCVLLITHYSTLHAQLVVKINGKAVTEDQVIDAGKIKKMEVSFSNPKKPKLTYGKAVLLVDFVNKEGYNYFEYLIVKDGSTAVDAFLEDVNTPFVLFDEAGNAKDMMAITRIDEEKNFFKRLEKGKSNGSNLQFKVKASLYFKDKIGYEKYGDAVDLLKPVNFVVNNGSADGSIELVGTGLKISAVAATSAKYDSQDKGTNILKSQPPILTNNEVTSVYLLKGYRLYVPININVVDTKGKSQDGALEELKNKFNLFLFRMSNICSKSATSKLDKMSSDEEKQWLQFFTNYTAALIAPDLCKEENKEWDKVVPLQPFTIGKLSGYKFSSVLKSSSCGTKPAERRLVSHTNFYLLKHSKYSDKVFIMFNQGDGNSESAEEVKDAEQYIEKFMGALE